MFQAQTGVKTNLYSESVIHSTCTASALTPKLILNACSWSYYATLICQHMQFTFSFTFKCRCFNWSKTDLCSVWIISCRFTLLISLARGRRTQGQTEAWFSVPETEQSAQWRQRRKQAWASCSRRITRHKHSTRDNQTLNWNKTTGHLVSSLWICWGNSASGEKHWWVMN